MLKVGTSIPAKQPRRMTFVEPGTTSQRQANANWRDNYRVARRKQRKTIRKPLEYEDLNPRRRSLQKKEKCPGKR
ncbi:hypothetical protein TSAR_002906 [Trichomalopsis sarcophagae]|uniref:Uncharacterized protein n=1 Tax=Trichomalopsis sarcophagae TaxID=543379 RepID=A0A232F755_9HYME|nr:hypothetical protein TSAR_002906 [Trichomalopsis sarcophagae]